MLASRLSLALHQRRALLEQLDPHSEHHAALRLFNGFTEGLPGLAADVYGSSLVIFAYTQNPQEYQPDIDAAVEFYRSALPWLHCVLLKSRRKLQHTTLLHGTEPDTWVEEFGVRYAIDLTLHQDATLYLDTRLLRGWILEHMAGKSVLNTFAYTGSLGAAARSAGARLVLHTDLDRSSLDLAQQTYRLNGWHVDPDQFIPADFFGVAARLKRQERLFDCIIIDPPFFSDTPRGRVDLNTEYNRLLNKVRPLAAHDGWLVAVNNAVFVSGAKFMESLNALTAHGYLSLESLIPVPVDFTGGPETRAGSLPSDPAPFNHSTKIAVLRVKRKDQRPAS